VPARQRPTGTIVVDVPERQDVGAVLDARVSAADQRADLDRQVARLAAFAAERGIRGATVVTEVGRGLNGPRKGLMAVLRAPAYGMIVVEHRDRLAGLARSPSRRRWLRRDGNSSWWSGTRCGTILGPDMLDVVTSFCARLYGRRSARRRAERALACAAAEAPA